ncbi:MAG: alpha/beta hydrolase [Myxococcaceae bacterium]
MIALTLALLAAHPGVFHRRVQAEDGTTIALHRFVPEAGGDARPSVLLIPDVGFSRAAYDLQGEGIARRLQGEGFDTFVVEPRGQGRSEAPADWHLTDIPLLDVRVALDAVQGLHPGKVDLVVHGFSGALVLGALSKELKGRVRRVIALTPAVAPDPPSLFMGKLLEKKGQWAQLTSSPEGAALFEILFLRNGRLPIGRAEALQERLLGNLSPSAAVELERWMIQGELAYPDGTTLCTRLGTYDRTTLLVLGIGDNFAQADFASPLRDLAPKAKMTVRVLNRREGFTEDYSHLSMLHGRAAAAEIERKTVRFLLDPDPPATVLTPAQDGAP